MALVSTYIEDLLEGSEGSYKLVNPHTKEEVATIPECSNSQMERAIQEAESVTDELASMSLAERSEILIKVAGIIEEEKERFASTIVKESAKPIKYARGEVDRTIETLKFCAVEARKLEGESIRLDAAPNGQGRDAYTIYEPLGVIGAITPFNFPLNLVVHKVGPAIAAGNTIVVKPAEKTPLSSFLLKEAFEKAGLPSKALAVVTGDGPRLGKVLIDHPDVKKITFTGSPEVGETIKSQVGLKKLTLELGNNSALYIDRTEEENLSEIAGKVATGAFSYSGQVCISTQRVYVHNQISEKFITELVQATSKLQYGDPFDEGTDIASLIDESSQARLLDWIEDATKNGAEILCGGKCFGYGLEPTIMQGVDASDKLSSREVFGPIVNVNVVNDSEEALEEMNDSRYGLNAGVFTSDIKTGLRMAHALDVGQVLVNDIPTLRFDHMPYGGRKDSGYGYEGVKYAIKEMTKMKMISLNYT
ncbi:aldehyde dehydrogenase family protein [Halobacillus salinus]|uniref:Aldehyde dehydrogenase family protein n=1 Tax=Halobacillus salinus TaxID=192814 RepID=A0A4Z0GXE1_9BACI|nr:aldehyde dehydrogenase family protein [Halobacillus salinus]TGB02460.1 aldehyde dehydrogenase family protein [Halobacillus salinus]